MSNKLTIYLAGRMGGLTKIEYNTWREVLKKKLEIAATCCNSIIQVINPADYFDLELIDRPYIRRVSFLGGECLAEQNLDEVLSLIKEIRISLPEKTIWLYTGFRWNYIMNYQPVETDDFDYIEESYNDGLMEKRKRIISLCDVVIDGEYIDEQKDLTLAYRGSKNQHVIDVKQSLAQNKMVLYCD